MTPDREEVFSLLAILSDETPDLRFGQLVANMAFLAAGPWNETLWDLEDSQLLAALRKHSEDLAARQQVAN